VQFRGPASSLLPSSLLKRWCPQTGMNSRRRRRRNSPVGTASGSPWTTPLFHKRRGLKRKPIHNTLFLLFFGCSSQVHCCHRHRRWRRRVPRERHKRLSSSISIATRLKRILTNRLPFFNYLSSPTKKKKKNSLALLSDSLNNYNQKQNLGSSILLSFHFWVKNGSILINKSTLISRRITGSSLKLWLEKQHWNNR